MRIYLFVLIAAMFCGCSLFKNTHTETETSSQQSSGTTDFSAKEEKNWLSKSGSVTLRRDTGNLDYTIQLWPKGRFTFSPVTGFSGEAAQIVMTGKAENRAQMVTREYALQQDKGKIAMQAKQQTQEALNQKHKLKLSAPSWKWVTGGLILVALIGLLVYLKLTK